MNVRVHNSLPSRWRDIYSDIVARWRHLSVQSISHGSQRSKDRADFLHGQFKDVYNVPTRKDQCMPSTFGKRIRDRQGVVIGIQNPFRRNITEWATFFRTNAHSTTRWIVRKPHIATGCHRSQTLIERDFHASSATVIWQPIVATLFPHSEGISQCYIFDSTNRRALCWIILDFIAPSVQKSIA